VPAKGDRWALPGIVATATGLEAMPATFMAPAGRDFTAKPIGHEACATRAVSGNGARTCFGSMGLGTGEATTVGTCIGEDRAPVELLRFFDKHTGEGPTEGEVADSDPAAHDALSDEGPVEATTVAGARGAKERHCALGDCARTAWGGVRSIAPLEGPVGGTKLWLRCCSLGA